MGKYKFDLIITDVIMPGISGPNLIRKIRAKFPEIKVIFMSGYAEEVFTNDDSDRDDFYFLQKPFTLNQLAIKVKEVLEENKCQLA